MADSKITALTALTAADPANDMLPVVDVSDTSMAASGTTKRISINNILACSPSATLASATITGDLTVDTSTLKVDSTNNRVGIKQASPSHPFQIGTTDLILDASANVGIGVSPTSYGGTYRTLAVNATDAGILDLMSNSVSQFRIFGTGVENRLGGITNVPLTFHVNNSEAMRLNTTANLVLKGGTTGATGVGVTFPATQVASSDANCLDDYEEGTFTPTVFGGTIAGTATYITQVGLYTKVGNLVTVSVFLVWSGFTVPGTGVMYFGGLPFTTSSTTNSYGAASITYVNNITLTASNVMNLLIPPSQVYFEAYQYPVGGGTTTNVPIDLAGSIIYTATYRV